MLSWSLVLAQLDGETGAGPWNLPNENRSEGVCHILDPLAVFLGCFLVPECGMMCHDTQGCESPIGHKGNVSEAAVNRLFFFLFPRRKGCWLWLRRSGAQGRVGLESIPLGFWRLESEAAFPGVLSPASWGFGGELSGLLRTLMGIMMLICEVSHMLGRKPDGGF